MLGSQTIGTTLTVLMSGDEFYKSTVQRLTDNNRLVSRLLMVDELNRNFSFSNKEVMFDIDDCCINGILGFPDDGSILNVKTGLEKFFGEYDFGVLTCRNISVAIWRKNDAYYYFDSHSRDEKGVTSGYGTACVIRVLTIGDLARSIEYNLYPQDNSYFNIGAVGVRMLEAEVEGGLVRQPLNNYAPIDAEQNIAILLSNTSNKDEKYEFNAGKQTVPQCVVALGMNRLRPSAGWTLEIIQTILDIGHKYFEDCMVAYETSDEEIGEDTGITSKNLTREFRIGVNRIEVTLEQIAEGFVEDGLEQAIKDYYDVNDKIDDGNNLELLVETENITVSIWKDENLFYIFDPYPRDDLGQVIGKDSWSAKIETVEEEAGEVAEGGDATAAASAQQSVAEEPAINPDRGSGDAGEDVMEEEIPKRPTSRGEGVFEPDAESVKDDDALGKACVLFFYHLADVVKHIFENTRPNRRSMMPFTLSKVHVKNTPIVKEIYDKDYGERIDNYSGNWHNFVELDHGHWILRGQEDLNSAIFPEENRGKQEKPAILASLAFAKLYAMSKMQPKHITSILCYGDRLLTYLKRQRADVLALDESLDLLEEEIKAILKNETYEFEDYPKTFVIGDLKVNMTMERNALGGDVNAKNVPEVLDVSRALNRLFSEAQFGILECKGYLVAVWKGMTVYYMFDPHKTGVAGVKSLIGYPSISRYLKTELLADTYLQSLPKGGLNNFYIHKFTVTEEVYQRPKDVMEQKPQEAKITGYAEIFPGKSILRGSFSQDDPKFGKGGNVLAAPVAVVALTMSLIHKPQTWSKLIVDEVIVVANELFNQTMAEMGPSFNPWEMAMDPYTVSKDYNVGVMRANFQIRSTTQTGVLDVRSPVKINLRQGLERFFAENSQGILYSPPNICYAIWEEDNEGFPVLYLYDPNSRGPSGEPMPHGTSCVVTFGSAKMAAEHIVSLCSGEDEKSQEFTIIPLEITVGPYETCKKKKLKRVAKAAPEARMNMVKYLAYQTMLDEKKTAKKKAFEQKKKLEAKKRYWQGRTGYFPLPKGQAILRGTHSLTSSCYQENIRGNQDIPVCIVAFVANCIVPVSEWTWKEIDAVLDAGDQLYIDSYIAYSPRDRKLGLQNIVRNIFIMNKKAHVTIYKPITIFGFQPKNLARSLEKWFLDETFCILNYLEQWLGVFFKRGFYYLFDPNERNETGCKPCVKAAPCEADCGKKPCVDGAACVLRFDKIDDLAMKAINNMLPVDYEPDENIREPFELVLVRLEGGVCQCV